MIWRVLGPVACLFAVASAVACSSDDDKATPPEVSAGAAGEAPSSGGGSSSGGPQAGSGGKTVGGAASAGAAGTPNNDADGAGTSTGGAPAAGGAGGESPSGGAPDGAAGEPSTPSGPVSPTCGAGKYDAGTPGCATCPALPTPNATAAIDCSDYGAGEHDGNGDLWLALGALSAHEPLGSQIEIRWVADDIEGSAPVDWEYSSLLERFVFHLPLEARYADEFTLDSWSFSDACGFKFSASAFHVYLGDGDSWQCGH